MSTNTANTAAVDLSTLVEQLRKQLADAKAEAAAAKTAAAKVGTLTPELVAALEEACTPATIRPLGDKGNTGWNFSGRVVIGGEVCQIGVNVIRKGGTASVAPKGKGNAKPEVDLAGLQALIAAAIKG